MRKRLVRPAYFICPVVGILLITIQCSFAALSFGPEQLVSADGSPISVPGYSVPSFVDWNEDGLKDLIVGEGSGYYTPRVRVYLNVGTHGSPQFSDYFYVQAHGSDLTVPGSGCMGLFPRVVDWNDDGNKDLLIGRSDGRIEIFQNSGTNENPLFYYGSFVRVGPPPCDCSKVDIDVGFRATPDIVDWNNDGKNDLVVGAYDGKIHIFINEGTNADPDFWYETFAQENGSDLIVPTLRSSPVVIDLDGDGKKDILAGNTEGQLLFYSNVGTDSSPEFSGYTLIEADGNVIDLMGAGDARSRPFVCDWNDDGIADILVGAGDGKVYLFRGVPEPASLSLLIIGGMSILLKRRR